MPQLQPVLDKYGFKDFEEVKAYNNAKGVDAYQHRARAFSPSALKT